MPKRPLLKEAEKESGGISVSDISVVELVFESPTKYIMRKPV